MPCAIPADEKELPTTNTLDEKIFDAYLKLCVRNGVKPVTVVLPVHPAIKKVIKGAKIFRDRINELVSKYKLAFVDLFDVGLPDNCFKDKWHLSSEGSAALSALVGAKLYEKKIISAGNILEMDNEYFSVLEKYFPKDYGDLMRYVFCKLACEDFNRLSEGMSKEECLDLMVRVFSEMTYDHLAKLARMFNTDDYNDLIARIFKISVEKIRRKDKIKVAFVLYDSSTWQGDYLYNLFAEDKRFEPLVFLCMRVDSYKRNITVQKELWHQMEQFDSAGLNIVALDETALSDIKQDLIFYLIPYADRLPRPFQLTNIKPDTLLAYIPYSFEVSEKHNAAYTAIVRVAWKQFFPSMFNLNFYNKKAACGTPQRLFSGYPKLDVFYKNVAEFKFNWKMARPDAKKIIWAPHHSIKVKGIGTAIFQWNYQFMYEFAKAHPEISWIVKPHSNLPVNSINGGVFPNSAAYEEYFQKWNDLPNAQVYTGAYYQDIFATSDGLIHDCGSFTFEYQYVDKPMIYLIRDMETFSDLAKEILSAVYTVDGKDLDGIAALIKRIFLDGDDFKAAERKKVFNKHLNYPKLNGMLASDFIYKNVADNLTP